METNKVLDSIDNLDNDRRTIYTAHAMRYNPPFVDPYTWRSFSGARQQECDHCFPMKFLL